jgi:hypothetical protein
MKKGDKFLLLFILIILGIVALQIFIPNTKSKTLIVRSDGKIVKTIPLSTNLSKKITVKSKEGFLTIEIDKGRVKVIQSTCRDKLCIKQGWIEKIGESIVCLPNRISISIIGKGENGINSITY